MPRSAGNRTDLLVQGPRPGVVPPGQGQPNGQPIAAPTGLPYGENQQLRQAQAVQPLPQVQGPAAASPSAAPFDMGAAMTAARNFMPPNLPSVHRPSERPNEPVTAGLPSAPGPPGPQAPASGTLAVMLASIGQATGNPALSQLAQRAQQAGQ